MDYTFNGRPKSYFWVYELDVKQELPTWPEMRIRERRWVNDKTSGGKGNMQGLIKFPI